MADYRTLEALQAITAQTVRAVTQSASIQAAATEIHQQTANSRAVTNKPDAAPHPTIASAAANATTVELSPAAKFPPLLAASSLASLQAHRPDAVLTAFIDLPALVSQQKSALPAEQARQSLVLANQLSRLTGNADGLNREETSSENNSQGNEALHANSARYVAKSYQAMLPWQQSSAAANSEVSSSAMSSYSADISKLFASNSASTQLAQAHAALPNNVPAHNASNSAQALLHQYSQAYQLAASPTAEAHWARMDIAVFEENAPQQADEETSYSASLQLQLPHLGTVVIQLALNKQQTDIAIQAAATSLQLLQTQQSQLKDAAQAWGLKLHTLVYSPLTTEAKAS